MVLWVYFINGIVVMETSLTAAILSTIFLVGTPKPIPQEAQIYTYDLPAIAGLWQIDLEEAECQERYNFGMNGQLNTTSRDEVTTGEYGFWYVEESELPILMSNTLHDNNGVDCLGNQIDQTNSAMTVFVKLNNKHSPTIMQWCNDPMGEECGATLRRILP